MVSLLLKGTALIRAAAVQRAENADRDMAAVQMNLHFVSAG